MFTGKHLARGRVSDSFGDVAGQRVIQRLAGRRRQRLIQRRVRVRVTGLDPQPAWQSKFYGSFTPSVRRLLNGVAMPDPHRSTVRRGA